MSIPTRCRRGAIALALGVGAVVLVGCGDDDAEAPVDSETEIDGGEADAGQPDTTEQVGSGGESGSPTEGHVDNEENPQTPDTADMPGG